MEDGEFMHISCFLLLTLLLLKTLLASKIYSLIPHLSPLNKIAQM